jgi:iron complex outermembrane receptor protein
VISTGFRAPNILELFGGVADSFLTTEDPCGATISDGPNRPANCAADGVPVGFVQPASQLKVSQGGNPLLVAETSDNFSIGLVWMPEFANWRTTIDWYDVEIEDAIGTPDPQDVITTCYDGAVPLADPNCSRIGRGPSGSVVRFDLLNENLDIIATSGIDVDSTWVMDTGGGELTFDLLLNWLNEYVETSSTGIVSDRTNRVAGIVSDWAAYPEWRWNFGVTLARNTWSVGLNWRHMGEMDITDVIGFENQRLVTPSIEYFDILGKYDVGSWTLMAGVTNLTDEDPPYVPDVSANTSGIYDFMGTFYFARASVSFE